MTGEAKHCYAILDMKVSASGSLAALSLGYEPEPGQSRVDIVVIDLKENRKVFEHKTISVLHLDWHPVYEKLMFVSVMNGLSAVDFTPGAPPVLTEGIIKHSIIFLELVRFSSSGKCAGYFLHNTALKQEEQLPLSEEISFKELLLSEEKSHLIFYEKGDISGKIIDMGRAWTWLGDDEIIFSRDCEIFITNIIDGHTRKVINHERFIFDILCVGKFVFVLSLDFDEFEFPEEGYGLFRLTPQTGEITPVKLDAAFSPRLAAAGDCLIIEMTEAKNRRLARYCPESGEVKTFTPEESSCILPSGTKENVFYLESYGESLYICRSPLKGGQPSRLLDLRQLFTCDYITSAKTN